MGSRKAASNESVARFLICCIADFKSADVAQVKRDSSFQRRQNTILRYSRLKICVTTLIAEICELERYWEILCSQGRDHRLQIVAALAGDPDLLVLNLRGHFEFCLANKAGDLFGS